MILFLERRLTFNGYLDVFSVGDLEGKYGFGVLDDDELPTSELLHLGTGSSPSPSNEALPAIAAATPAAAAATAPPKLTKVNKAEKGKRYKYVQIPVDVSTEQVCTFFLSFFF